MNSRAPILFLRSSRQCTGLERRILMIACAARDAGYQPHIAVFHRPDEDTERIHPLIQCATSAGVTGYQIADSGPLSFATLRDLRDLIVQIKPAIIHTNDYRSNMLALLARCGAGCRPRLVATCHGHTDANIKLRLYETLDRRALTCFDRVIGVSQHQCAEMCEWGLTERQIVHIPNPVEPDWSAELPQEERRKMRMSWESGDADILIGFFGRHSPEKGLDTLLTAWPAVREAFPATRLLVMGGDGRPVSTQYAGPGIHWVSHQDDIRPFLAACDMIVAPSHREAFGLVALEALAAGKPVIASETGGLPEIVQDGETGCLVPPANPHALAEAIIHALHHWPATRRMGRQGQTDVQNRFPACSMLENMLALYAQVL